MNEFNQIKEAYHRNLFATAESTVDVLGLYKNLSDLTVTSDTDENLYHLATRFTDVEAIAFLKESGLKPAADKYGNTPLHALTSARFDLKNPELKSGAIRNTAQLLLELGVNPKKKNDSGKFAYFEAGLLYLYPFMEAMGAAGMKMDAVDSEGKNLLHVICEKLVHRKTIEGAIHSATQTVRIILEKSKIDVEDKDVYGATPLTYAQRSGVKEIAALICGDESDVATGGMTIHESILNRDPVALEALIKSGVDLNEVSDQYRRTPLMLACEYPSADLVGLLAKGGVDANFRSGNGETAVFYLIAKAVSNFGRGMSKDLNDIIKILKVLHTHGLDLDAAVNNEGDTALNLVCQAGYLADLNTQLVEELIVAGCDLNKPNLAGKTPLMSFAERGNEPKYGIAELLLDNQVDVTYVDKSGNTALIYAAGNPDQMSAKKLVGLLLDYDNSTIERTNNAGQTAMDLAIRTNNEAVVKQLIG